MHSYIPHLLSDIATAQRIETAEEITEPTIEQHFEEINKWINGEEPEHTFGYYCGLNPQDFPPAEQLTGEEMMIVRKAFDQMMRTWNHRFNLPENLPVAFAYTLMVNSLNQETSIDNKGCVDIDFCCYYAPDCELKEYCFCLEIWNEEPDEDMNMDYPDKNEFPF